MKDKFPLKEYEVWMQGYAATGQSAKAQFIGKVEARSFKQACHILMCQDYLKNHTSENLRAPNQWIDPDRWDYDPDSCSYWGCKLFDNETDARKTYG
jgi:hypothetical protein